MKGIALLVLAAVATILPLVGVGDRATILFVGDMSFDRYIRKVSVEKGGDFVFSCIGNFLKEFDLVVGNLEGPITENESVSLGLEIGSPQNFVFTFPPETADLLAKYNIKLVNLGNNHIGNFGISGITSTRSYLEKEDVNFFGGIKADTSNHPAEPIYRTKLRDMEFSFISYNQFGGASPEEISKRILEERKEGREVVVYAHWGEEYASPTLHMRKSAKMFADSGALAVIGSHPHVIQESEKIGETFVYYSLGNFIFDQYWTKEVRTGLLLEMKAGEGKISIIERKVEAQKDGRVCLLK
jgi:poly-gamma-glutamate synthesis protein (capsule biosynthesis protein)